MAILKYEDEQYIGFRSGKLTVVGFTRENKQFRWQCKCDCNGNIKSYHPSKVFLGRIRSCGCEKINSKTKYTDSSYIGKIYSKLQVLRIGEPQGRYDGVIWRCKCLICGRDDIEFPAKHIVAGRYTTCSSVECRRKAGLTTSIYDNIRFIGQIYGYLQVLKFDYRFNKGTGSTQVYWYCKCLNCGRHVWVKAEAVVNGNNISCGCIKSIHERWLQDILDKYNISYEKEISFDILRGLGGKPLRFDFGIYKDGELHKIIEYDGAQHFCYTEILWDTETLQLHDQIKTEFCKYNGIELIRINKRFNCIESLEKYLIDNKIIEV